MSTSILTRTARVVQRFSQQTLFTTRGTHRANSSTALRYPYFVSRNSNGNLPVYSDIRNGGTRYLVSIRNVEGNANALARELSETLFKLDSEEATRMKIEILRSRNLIISGGRWKNNIVEWLKAKGF